MSGQEELSMLLDLASQGLLPLFHQEWIRESFGGPGRRMSFARASKVVQDGLKRLERHQSFDRKQTALGAFSNDERQEFIQSFFKMVEYKTLDGLKELH
jgi:hypothetical protein